MAIKSGLIIISFIIAVASLTGCAERARGEEQRESFPSPELSSSASPENNRLSSEDESSNNGPVKIDYRDSLNIYFPQYSRIDLVCGNRPSQNDTTVIFMAEAAFTGEHLKEFKHSNICGDHVSAGKRYSGSPSPRNTGAFVWYNGTPQFLYKDYSHELDKAAANGGCGFGQEMMIHDGKIVKHTRPDGNINEFRALCLIDGKVAIADSNKPMRFGDFINELLKAGVKEALYLDMGFGWNYSWYRDASGEAVEIHSIPTKYATNWITFYR